MEINILLKSIGCVALIFVSGTALFGILSGLSHLFGDTTAMVCGFTAVAMSLVFVFYRMIKATNVKE